jgi:hypothetical protein
MGLEVLAKTRQTRPEDRLYCCFRGSAVIHFSVRRLERLGDGSGGVSGREVRDTGRCA